jgi:hypothetical protein
MTAQPNQPGDGLPRRVPHRRYSAGKEHYIAHALIRASSSRCDVGAASPLPRGAFSFLFNGRQASEFEQSAIPLDVYSLRMNGETENACGR